MSEVAIELVERFPGVADYRRLRAATGLSAKSEPAALRGLANTTHGVSLLRDGEVWKISLIVIVPLPRKGSNFNRSLSCLISPMIGPIL